MLSITFLSLRREDECLDDSTVTAAKNFTFNAEQKPMEKCATQELLILITIQIFNLLQFITV